MEQTSLDEFFAQYAELLMRKNPELAKQVHHFPCIIMDRTSFIPCSSIADVELVHNDFVKNNISIYKGIRVKAVVKSSKMLSQSLKLINVAFEVYNDNDILVNTIFINFNVIFFASSYSIVVTEVLSSNIPRIQNMIKYKAQETNDNIAPLAMSANSDDLSK